MDKVQAKATIVRLRPTDWTPIGLALRAAGPATSAPGDDTPDRPRPRQRGTRPPPDPCEVARNLAVLGTHLVVDTRGITLDEKVRRRLTCIADATCGTYTAVQHGRSRRTVAHVRRRVRQFVRAAAGLPGRQFLLLPAYVRRALGMPLELTVDLVPSSDAPGGPDLAAAGCCCWCSPGPAWSAASSWDGSPAGGSPSGKRTDRAHRPLLVLSAAVLVTAVLSLSAGRAAVDEPSRRRRSAPPEEVLTR